MYSSPFCSSLSFTFSFISSQHLSYEASSSLKGFHELGLGMNQRLRFIHFASLALQLFDWLHAECIGTLKDLILSLEFEIYLLVVMQHDLHMIL